MQAVHAHAACKHGRFDHGMRMHITHKADGTNKYIGKVPPRTRAESLLTYRNRQALSIIAMDSVGRFCLPTRCARLLWRSTTTSLHRSALSIGIVDPLSIGVFGLWSGFFLQCAICVLCPFLLLMRTEPLARSPLKGSPLAADSALSMLSVAFGDLRVEWSARKETPSSLRLISLLELSDEHAVDVCLKEALSVWGLRVVLRKAVRWTLEVCRRFSETSATSCTLFRLLRVRVRVRMYIGRCSLVAGRRRTLSFCLRRTVRCRCSRWRSVTCVWSGAPEKRRPLPYGSSTCWSSRTSTRWMCA